MHSTRRPSDLEESARGLPGSTLTRRWRAGWCGCAAIGRARRTPGKVCGYQKQGAAYGYTRLFGYHPILATRADTRKTLHIHLRKGSANAQKGIKRFCEELIARVERAGARGIKLQPPPRGARVSATSSSDAKL